MTTGYSATGGRILRSPCASMAAAVAGLPAVAAACPVCHSETGRAVRAGIFDERFVETLLMVAAPFPVLLGVVWAVREMIFATPPATPRSIRR